MFIKLTAAKHPRQNPIPYDVWVWFGPGMSMKRLHPLDGWEERTLILPDDERQPCVQETPEQILAMIADTKYAEGPAQEAAILSALHGEVVELVGMERISGIQADLKARILRSIARGSK